ncbi:MAG: translation elongation factor 4, partial [Clostridia bacterium]|nr:translation elongation factor 4 [Clostridia bacterium]
KGAISFIRVGEGSVKVGDRIRMMASGKEYDVTEVGVFTPGMRPVRELKSGEVGYLAASIKNVVDTAAGDTITLATNPTAEPYGGYKEVKPVVFAGIYPADGSKYNELRESLEKLKLNDASLFFEPDVSTALGFGFRCGFLGLLHMDVITARLEREFDLDLVTTAPSVSYRVFKTNGEMLMIDNPTKLPNPSEIEHIEEPIVKLSVFTPPQYVGSVMELCQGKRGVFTDMTYLDPQRVLLLYKMPLSEILYDFFDSLKSRSRGYASLDYDMDGYMKNDMVRLDILLNGEMCDALSMIVFRDSAYDRGRKVAERLKEAIPRQMFEIPIQACIGNKVIARETVKALRKDVLAKCYGGDITRKKKLLEKQKEGKKRMRQVGSVEIPSEAFMSILKVGDDE